MEEQTCTQSPSSTSSTSNVLGSLGLVCLAMFWFPLVKPEKVYSAPFTVKCPHLEEQLDGFASSDPEQGVDLLKVIQPSGAKKGIKLASPGSR